MKEEKAKLQRGKKEKEEEEKRKCLKDLENKKRKFGERDSDTGKEQAKQEKELRTAQRLFQEANERLQQALKEKNMGEMTVVSALMEATKKKMQDSTKKLEDCRQEKEVHAERRKIIDRIQEQKK